MDAWIIACISVAAGAAIGAAIAYLYSDRRSKVTINELRTARALAEQKNAGLEEDLQSAEAGHQQRVIELQREAARHEGEAGAVRQELGQAQSRSAALAAQLEASEKNISEQKKLLDDARQKLTEAFAAVSQSALARSNETFLQMAEARFKTLSTEAAGTLDERKAQIGTLLKPLEETLTNYQKRLAEVEATRSQSYTALREQVAVMSATQQTLSTQTSQLVSALKKSNVRGRWGEIALQRLAEMAGMTEHVDFVQQESLRSEEGRLLRPDMTVRLPGERCVVVDAKAVMNAFLEALAVTDEAARQPLMQAHARNVRSRIDDLADKAYWRQFATAPEYVVLFLPGESFLYAACDADPDLIEYALSKSVLLATPTTFIGRLLTIEHGWRQQAISENAEAIRKLGTEIYDRLATLADSMMRLGKSLDSAVDQYNKTVGTLESRVLVSARKIGELGAHSDKEIESAAPVDKRTREFAATLHPDKSPLLPQ